MNMNKKSTKRIFLNPEVISCHLRCGICLDVFEDPVRTACGHTFCYVCIEQAVVRTRKCPLCASKSLLARKFEKDLIAFNLIDDLPTACAHPECYWTGSYSLLKKHQRCCVFKPISYKPVDSTAISVDSQTLMEILSSDDDSDSSTQTITIT